MKAFKYLYLLFLTCLLIGIMQSRCFSICPVGATSTSDNIDGAIPSSGQIALNPEASFRKLTESLSVFIQKKDTAKAILCLINLGDIERFRGNYISSFDFLWDAFLFGDQRKDSLDLVQINRNLGILYDIYKQDSIAIEYLSNSLSISKKLMSSNKVKIDILIPSYFSIATHYRDQKKYKLALAYLDSCAFLKNENTNQPFVEAERGFVYMHLGQFDRSQSYLHFALRNLLKSDPRYRIVVLSYLGDLKEKINQMDSAFYYYSESLKELESKNAYIEYKPELLQKLAKIHQRKGEYELAFNDLQASKIVSDSLFNATNRKNNQLFEIKNKYKEALVQKEAFIKKQNEIIDYKNKIQFRLIVFVSFILLISLSILIFFRFRSSIRKLASKNRMEKEKNSELVELKNKELASYALQIIEKERSVNELLDELKKDSSRNYHVLHHNHSKTSENMWRDFNRRFIEINSQFYNRLRERHPDLTVTELKHCALIKLNLDNQEMAQILNISLQSVHTSRYRIRKKMHLGQDESLTRYIMEF